MRTASHYHWRSGRRSRSRGGGGAGRTVDHEQKDVVRLRRGGRDGSSVRKKRCEPQRSHRASTVGCFLQENSPQISGTLCET